MCAGVRVSDPGRKAFCFFAIITLALLAAGSAPQMVANGDPTEQISGASEHAEIRRLLAATNYPAAESRARALVASLERSGPESLELAEALDLLVQALVEGGKPTDPAALPSATRAIALKEKTPAPRRLRVGGQPVQPRPRAAPPGEAR